MTYPNDKQKNLIFLHSSLDELGLDPYEFRLLCHISRRGLCYASLNTTAEICNMSVRKAQSALKFLVKEGLVMKETRRGRSDIYSLPNPNDLADRIKLISKQLGERKKLKRQQRELKKDKTQSATDLDATDSELLPEDFDFDLIDVNNDNENICSSISDSAFP